MERKHAKPEKKGAKKEVPKAESGKKEQKPAVRKPEAGIKKPEERLPEKPRKIKCVYSTGKRKMSVARAVIKPGTGMVKINSRPIELEKNNVYRLRVQEPLLVSGVDWRKFNFTVKVRGGGIMGQAEAARQAIARGLVDIFGSPVKQRMMEYDRNLLVYDPRQTEPHKPPRSSQGPRRYKQRSKR